MLQFELPGRFRACSLLCIRVVFVESFMLVHQSIPIRVIPMFSHPLPFIFLPFTFLLILHNARQINDGNAIVPSLLKNTRVRFLDLMLRLSPHRIQLKESSKKEGQKRTGMGFFFPFMTALSIPGFLCTCLEQYECFLL
jgi:hypothetical protein